MIKNPKQPYGILRINRDLWKRLKAVCLNAEIAVKDATDDAISKWLAERGDPNE